MGPGFTSRPYGMLTGMTTSPVLYVIVCACPPARDVGQLVELAQERGWDTCVLTTPLARRFVDVDELAALTGHPVRSEYKHPGEPDVLPPADALIVAPATVNTINKWAAGICDTLALGIVVEGIGLGLPIVAVPSSNRAHTSHPAFVENIARLRSWGVTVVWETDGYPVHDPMTGSNTSPIPWQAALDAITVRTGQQ
jgi:phosphopantothenoylcysteine synthetase/decarboxylase